MLLYGHSFPCQDITAVQMFIDKAIQTLGFASPMDHIKGKEQISSRRGNILSADEDLLDELPKNFITRKKMCSVQNRQASLELSASTCKLIAIEDELNCLSRAEHDVVPIQFSNLNPDDLRNQEHEIDFGLSRAEHDVVPIQFSNQNTDDLRGQDLELDFGCQNGSSFQSWDFSLARSKPKASGKHENHLCISGDNFLSAEEFYLENRVTATERSGSGVESFTLPWENESSEVNFIFDNGLAVRALSCDCEGFSKNLEMREVTMKPILKSCSSTYSTERELCMDGELDFQSGVLRAKEIGTGHYNPEIDDKKQSFDFLPRSFLQDHGSITQNFSRGMTNSPLSSEVDSFPRELLKPIPSYVEHFDKIYGFPSGFVTNTASTGLNSEWFSVNLNPLSQLVPWDVQHNIDNDILGGSCMSSGNHFVDIEENNCRLSFGTMSKSTSQENCTSCKNSRLDYAHSSKFLERHNFNNNFPPEC